MMRILIGGWAFAIAACAGAPAVAAPVTVLVSVPNIGASVAQGGTNASNSGDGRYVAFQSSGALVPEDTNGVADIYVRDLVAGTTARVSVADAGGQADNGSETPSISADGRYVAFRSWATNLVVNDRNAASDIFVRDTVKGTTRRANIAWDGTEANGDGFNPRISADGRCVAYASGATNLVQNDANGKDDIFLRDMVDGTRERVSVSSTGAEGNGNSSFPKVSADGRYVVFNSAASNLIPNDFNTTTDGFVRDRVAGTTARVDLANDGEEASTGGGADSISADGRFVCFTSSAPHLVDGDTNGKLDVFLRDMTAGTTVRISVATDGTEGNNGATGGILSADNRYALFVSGADNLVPGDTNDRSDAFVRDLAQNTTARVTLGANGGQAEETTYAPAFSADGSTVAWHTFSTNLTPGDTNGFYDVYARGPLFNAPPSLADAALALQIAAGLATPTPDATSRLNLETNDPAITLADAAAVARRIAGSS
jgi:Tol biopolymer transport system component